MSRTAVSLRHGILRTWYTFAIVSGDDASGHIYIVSGHPQNDCLQQKTKLASFRWLRSDAMLFVRDHHPSFSACSLIREFLECSVPGNILMAPELFDCLATNYYFGS